MDWKRTLLLAAILCLRPLAGTTGETAPTSGDRSVEVSRAAVLPPAGQVKPDLAFSIHEALREEAVARGWQLCDEDDIRVALTGREGPGFASPDLIELGRWLGAGVVVATELADLGGEIEIKIRVLSTIDGPSAMQLRMAAKKAAAKEARTGLAAALPQAPPAAAVRVPPSMPPAPEPSLPASALPVQVVTLPPGYILVAPGVFAAPAPVPTAVGEHKAPAPPAAVPGDPERELPSEGGRAAKVFGITVGVQAGALALTTLLFLDYAPSGTDLKTVAIMYSTIAPAVSGLGGWGIGNRSRISTISYPAILGGAYAGSAVNLALFLFTYDNLGESWFYTMVLGPILLPAAGAAIAFAVGREPRSGRGAAVALAGGRLEWSLPAPTVVAATDGSRRLSPGLSLGTLTF
ncbi:MAG TPA: hypothetical protein VM285_10305 [Polyangia bacterium]|nr:hypothetical protein [Polyangia bacterium]